MNLLKIKGGWIDLGSKLKQKFANRTDDDSLFSKGKEKGFWGRFENKRAKAKEQLHKIISKF